MKTHPTDRQSGSLLLETVLAVAVMAVIVPVAMMAMAKACKSGQELRAETLGLWAVPACLEEWQATDQPRALALSGDGTVLGPLTESQYGVGLAEVEGRRVSYLCGIEEAVTDVDEHGLRKVRLSLEYPAVAVSAHRRRIEFHTRMR